MHRAAAPLLAAVLSLLASTAGAQVYDGYPAPSSQDTPYRTVPYDEAPSQSPPYDAPSPAYPPPYYGDADAPPPDDAGYGAQGYPDTQYGDDGGDDYGNAYPPQGGASGPVYDYARVVRVDPVYAPSRAPAGTRCYRRDDSYADGGSGGGFRDDGYAQPRTQPTQGGRAAATIVGGVVGALVGSRFGGGSARYATSALGTMAGGLVGQRVYDQSHAANGSVTVCDPVQDDRVADDPYGSGGAAVQAYDVTYEYAGRQYVTRTDYNPGARIRVRVDVQPQ